MTALLSTSLSMGIILASNSSSFVYDTLVVFGTCPALYSSGVRTSIKRGLFGEFL
eukprot:CAMPEP_0202369848 /NCGR_PEP_ID=MMETSP1127-20130417/1600_1 /ASSEMBLY_ACC=CAM_ASM_000462 /TAXON_ID=3047 /ORGANISM="Dunaliella tertiolecta, Strain CCMP1320" /LENGTH=54 /DNA_ID=CAMNT_0048965629 /DNA_START=465 /DNA_END=629 /DNA_ORIENTATION=+